MLFLKIYLSLCERVLPITHPPSTCMIQYLDMLISLDCVKEKLEGSFGKKNDIYFRVFQLSLFFRSAFVPCASWAGYDEGNDFLNSTWRVR